MWLIHWKRWCRRDLHLQQVPKGFSLQSHRGSYATVTVPAGRLQHVFPLALAQNSWCGKRMGNEHKAACSLLSCRTELAAALLSPAVKSRMLCHHGLQWEDNFRHWEFTAAASWEEGQRWDTAVHPPVFHRGYNQRENYHTLGDWSIWSEIKSVHLIRAKMKLFWNQVEKYAASVNSSVKKLTSNKTKKNW